MIFDPVRRLFGARPESARSFMLSASVPVDPAMVKDILAAIGVAGAFALGFVLERAGDIDLAARVQRWSQDVFGGRPFSEWVSGNNLPTEEDIAKIQEELSSQRFAEAQAQFQGRTAADLAEGMSFADATTDLPADFMNPKMADIQDWADKPKITDIRPWAGMPSLSDIRPWEKQPKITDIRPWEGMPKISDIPSGVEFLPNVKQVLPDDLSETPTSQGDTPSLRSVLSQRLSGDGLENAIDLAQELQEKGGEITADGLAVLYHRTSADAAAHIVSGQEMAGKEDGLFFGTRPDGQIEGYGDTVVRVEIPLENLLLNDVFSDEAHVRMPTGVINQPIPVRASFSTLEEAGSAIRSALARGLEKAQTEGNSVAETSFGRLLVVFDTYGLSEKFAVEYSHFLPNLLRAHADISFESIGERALGEVSRKAVNDTGILKVREETAAAPEANEGANPFAGVAFGGIDAFVNERYPVSDSAESVEGFDVPNMGSISATLDDYDILPGIRNIPLADFGLTGKSYSTSENERIRRLAEEIAASQVVAPLIIVIEKDGPYILEGGHRAEALYNLGATAFPAVVVIDRTELTGFAEQGQGGVEQGVTISDSTDAFGNAATDVSYQDGRGGHALARIQDPVGEEGEIVGNGKVLNLITWSATPLSAIARRGLAAEEDYKGKGFGREALAALLREAEKGGATHFKVFAPSADTRSVLDHYVQEGVITPVEGMVDLTGYPALWGINSYTIPTGANAANEQVSPIAKQPWEMTKEEFGLADYYHGSSQGEIVFADKAPKFNYYGRRGIYLTSDPNHAESYALGMETTPEKPLVYRVSVTAENEIDASSPLGEKYASLRDAIIGVARERGLSDIGMDVLVNNLGKRGGESSLAQLAAGDITIGAFLVDALAVLGYDAIRDQNVLVAFGPEQVTVVDTIEPGDTWRYGTSHKEYVQQALADGLPVPPEVLAEYPDLQTTREPWEMTEKEYAGYSREEVNEMLLRYPSGSPEHEQIAAQSFDEIRPLQNAYADSVREAVSSGKLTLEEGQDKIVGWKLDFLKPIPEGSVLYHITVGFPGVQERGLLLHDDVIEQGGSEGIGGASNVISFTTNKEYAEHIASGLALARDSALGRIRLSDLLEESEKIRPGITEMVQEYARTSKGLTGEEFRRVIAGEGIETERSRGPFGTYSIGTMEEIRWELFKSINTFIGGAQYIAIWGYPGEEALANWHIGLVEGVSVPGAHGEWVMAEDEWRVYSPQAVEIQNIQDRETQALGSSYLGVFVGVRPWAGPGRDPIYRVFGRKAGEVVLI